MYSLTTGWRRLSVKTSGLKICTDSIGHGHQGLPGVQWDLPTEHTNPTRQAFRKTCPRSISAHPSHLVPSSRTNPLSWSIHPGPVSHSAGVIHILIPGPSGVHWDLPTELKFRSRADQAFSRTRPLSFPQACPQRPTIKIFQLCRRHQTDHHRSRKMPSGTRLCRRHVMHRPPVGRKRDPQKPETQEGYLTNAPLETGCVVVHHRRAGRGVLPELISGAPRDITLACTVPLTTRKVSMLCRPELESTHWQVSATANGARAIRGPHAHSCACALPQKTHMGMAQ